MPTLVRISISRNDLEKLLKLSMATRTASSVWLHPEERVLEGAIQCGNYRFSVKEDSGGLRLEGEGMTELALKSLFMDTEAKIMVDGRLINLKTQVRFGMKLDGRKKKHE